MRACAGFDGPRRWTNEENMVMRFTVPLEARNVLTISTT